MTQSGAPIDPISTVGPEAITERQREVARLVAAGRTNTEIAEELGITLDGAKYHVSELLGRLGLRRREEVAEWYRAHFGPVARVRSFLRGLVGLPVLGLLGGASAVGGVIAVTVIAFVALRGASAPDEIGPPDYVPFIQEWEITGAVEPTRTATLEWNGCGDWEYREADASGQVYTAHGWGPPTEDEPGCHVPSHWFTTAGPQYVQIGPFEYEFAYTRACSELSNPIESDNPYGPDFCSEPGDTFEDRVVLEFDPDTSIPMRYSQYIDGALASERRATSLRLLDADEVRVLPTSDFESSGDRLLYLGSPTPDATAQATAIAIPQEAGTFETLLQWVPEGYGHGLRLGDMEAWRDLESVEAPDDATGEEAYLADLSFFQRVHTTYPSALTGPTLTGIEWYLGVQSNDPLELSARTEEAFGFGLRHVDAFAEVERVDDPSKAWGIVAGEFDPDAILDTLAQCAECEPAEEDTIVANPVYSWGDGRSFSIDLRYALPIFDDLGRGGTMAFFDNRVIHATDLDEMRVTLESPPISSDPVWTRAAQIFDAAGALYAHFATEDERPDPEVLARASWDLTPPDAASLPPLEPYRFMALGGGQEDGVPFSVLLLAFEDAATADANVDVVRERLEAIPDGASPQQWGDPEIAAVTSDGALIVVRLEGRALGGLHLWMMQTVLPGLPPAVP